MFLLVQLLTACFKLIENLGQAISHNKAHMFYRPPASCDIFGFSIERLSVCENGDSSGHVVICAL